MHNRPFIASAIVNLDRLADAAERIATNMDRENGVWDNGSSRLKIQIGEPLEQTEFNICEVCARTRPVGHDCGRLDCPGAQHEEGHGEPDSLGG